ncbi:MAG: AAA family ATPase [Mycobacteriales bacterium]|nr:AAA family ATPase [Mycobacteriales bacterium]
MTTDAVRIAMLGGFTVERAGRRLPSDAWPTRRAVELVQLLCLADGRRLHREQVVDALWPTLDVAAGAANLRKAAHHARTVLGDRGVVLRGGQVELLPDQPVALDVTAFEQAAALALRSQDSSACADAARLYAGDLLPGSPYDEWVSSRREVLRTRWLELLRRSGDWASLVHADPTDEAATAGLMRVALASSDRHGALRAYARLRSVLERDVGARPGAVVQGLYADCVAGMVPSEPESLVGRDLELAAAEAALAPARAGSRSALVVRGPGGIGKSALCAALGARAEQAGWRVVRVRASADEGPFAPFVQAVEVLLGGDRGLLERLPAPTRGLLAELSPLAGPQVGPSGPVTRHQVIGAVRRLLRAAAGGAGTVLVVDDVHWADDDAVEALGHLASSGGPGLLVVLGYRPEAAGQALQRVVARLARHEASTVVELPPLDDGDAAALVTATADGLADDVLLPLVRRAQGNPLVLQELARGARDGRSATSVHEAVAARLVDLDEGTRAMVQRLAVAADGLDPAAVLALTGLAEPEAFAVLDAALAAGVLVVRGSSYAFRHDLVRQVLVEQMPPHRRVAVHRDAARRLAELGAAPEVVAAHWLSGERPREALPWLLLAAQRSVGLGAYADALARLDVLLAQEPGHAEALRLRAQCLEARGDERAPSAYAAAAGALPAGQRDDVLAMQALASVRAGDPAGALLALDGLQPTTLQGRLAQALAMCGAAAMGHADPDVGVAMAAETRALAIASGDPSAMVIASWAEAAAAHVKGELPRTMRAGLRETYALPEVAVTVFDGQLCVAERLLYGGQPYGEVIDFTRALEAEADRLGAARGKAFAVTFRGEALLLMGRLDEAGRDLAAGVQLHRAIGANGGEALALERLAAHALAVGDPDRADALLDEALDVARESGLGFHLFDRIYGTRIAAARSPAAALAALDEAEEAVHGSMETCPGCRINLAVPAALAAAAGGRAEQARAYEQAAAQLTTILMRLPGWYAAVDEVRGHRARAEGDEQAALRHLAAAAEGFGSVGQPLDAQRCADAATALV